jgi:hypothetical protein
MNHGALLKRAFHITKRYPVLWLFGILVALTSGGSSGSGNGSGYNFNEADLHRENWPDWLPVEQGLRQLTQWIEQFDPSRYVGWFIACCCLLVVIVIVALVVRYVARAALMRSVDQIEATGSAPTWRAGFRLGWSNRAFRLWLLELIVCILAALAALVLMAAAASPLLLLLTQNDVARAIGIVLTVILGVPAILVLIAAAIALSVLGQFWSREVVLGDRSIGAALSAGYAEVRRRLKDVGVLWLLMAGIQIGYMILLVPVVLVLLALAGLLGAGLGYAVFGLADSVAWAIGVGLPIFLLILAIPLTFIGGLYETFKSSAWTLAYREVAPLAAV